jgi:N-acetylglucosamine kinase-like BadF-type ATPase
MSLFSRIVSHIWTDLYPHVEAVIKKAENVADRVEEQVLNIAETARDAVENVADIVTNSHVACRMQEEILDARAAQRVADGDDDLTGWRTSIVDLLKLVDIDSSVTNRRALAREVGIVGYAGTGAQNVELSKRVLAKLRGA